MDRLRTVCQDMHAPQEFVEIIGQHLQQTGFTIAAIKNPPPENINNASATSSLVSFMAKAFIRCTHAASLGT
jgi:hypothetical protein